MITVVIRKLRTRFTTTGRNIYILFGHRQPGIFTCDKYLQKMNFCSYLLFLILILLPESNFKEHSYGDDYAKELLDNSFSNKSIYNLSTKKINYPSYIFDNNYKCSEIIDSINTPKTICFKFDSLIFNLNFLSGILTLNSKISRYVYKHDTNYCSNNNIFYIVQQHTDVHNSHNVCGMIMHFSHNIWLHEHVYDYDIDIRNIFIFRKSTMTFTDIYFSRIYCQIISILNNSTNTLSNYFVNLDCHQTRINWVYLAKYLSTPKYSLSNVLCYNAKPKTSVLIILLLFISGDTGASINPGPKINCSYCDKIIRYNINVLTCQLCNIKVHSKCNNISKSTDFICYLPMYK